MTDKLPNWADTRCPSCHEPMVNSEYDRCYSCVSNKRISRDAAKQAGPDVRAREKQLRIEAAMEEHGHVRLDFSEDGN